MSSGECRLGPDQREARSSMTITIRLSKKAIRAAVEDLTGIRRIELGKDAQISDAVIIICDTWENDISLDELNENVEFGCVRSHPEEDLVNFAISPIDDELPENRSVVRRFAKLIQEFLRTDQTQGHPH